MPFSRAVIVALACFSLVTFVAHASMAQGAAKPTAAETKKKEADALMSERRYDDALAAYDAAYALEPNPVLLYNRGRALQYLARYPEALDSLERFRAEAPEEVRAKVATLDELIEQLRQRVTTLEIRCDVPGAQVRLGDRVVGTTPLDKPLVVTAGDAQLEVVAEGRKPFSRALALKGGEKVVVEVTLEPPPPALANLRVRSRKTGVQVFVDGRAVGPTPASGSFTPGLHKVRVESAGHDPASTDLVLAAGSEKDIVLDPIERPSIASRWWFWAGIGTLVAGGVVAGFALTTERSGDTGTFSPGALRVP